jgi:hypothetical protein
MAVKKTPPPPTIPAWMQDAQKDAQQKDIDIMQKSDTPEITKTVKVPPTLTIELSESATDFPCVVVQGRGSRDNVSYINVPFTPEQIQRLQSRIFGNQAVAIPVLLMRALDEIEGRGIRLEIKATRQSS